MADLLTKPPVVAVVLPCLNEEVTLWDTCQSLGFLKSAAGKPAPNTFLFIIDNGSTDRTLDVAREIQRDASLGSVFIGQEKELGYVPPRHTGNMLVSAFAEYNGLERSEILILQADADTSYEEGYIEQMRSTSQALGSNILLEGLAEFSRGFGDSFPEYVALCADIDLRVFSVLKPQGISNLVCTDAVCGYRLSDYFAWGGHVREYRADGDEIHAETTRLYMRALARGGRKYYVEEALAYPSERKIISSPIEQLATAGFPREAFWKGLGEQLCYALIGLEDFRARSDHPAILHAIHLREQHLVALFGVLPLHVMRALEGSLPLSPGTALADIAASLPERDLRILSHFPGTFLTDVLNLVDRNGPALSRALGSQIGA